MSRHFNFLMISVIIWPGGNLILLILKVSLAVISPVAVHPKYYRPREDVFARENTNFNLQYVNILMF